MKRRPLHLTPMHRMTTTIRILSSLAAVTLLIAGCDHSAPEVPAPPPHEPTPSQPSPGLSVPTYGYKVVQTLPHDHGAFTQGLEYHDGVFYESTGQVGQSSLRKVDPMSGTVLQKVDVSPPHFAEGMTIVGDRIFQLTWQSGVCFVYDLESFQKVGEFDYTGEGWGLTTLSDHEMAMSDGTNQLRFVDPTNFEVHRSVFVTDGGRPVSNLNELEYVDGSIYANIWQTDRIARIDPADGNVTAWIDLTGILPVDQRQGVDVLNGIAWNPTDSLLYVTGKYWPSIFEIRLVDRTPLASK